MEKQPIFSVLVFPFQNRNINVGLSGLLKSHLFKVALHGLVGQQQDGPHQVSHQDEVPLGLQVESHDVVVMVALGPQLLLGRPLVQPHLKQMAVGDVFGCFFFWLFFSLLLSSGTAER